MIDNANLPAFPASASWNDSQPEIIQIQQEGLTKREYFAAMAMQGLCANSVPGVHHRPENLTTEAIEIADLMIKKLSQ